MKKISKELLDQIINALVSMQGLSYLQVQNLLNAIGKLENIEESKKNE